jgi:hypothetical protein
LVPPEVKGVGETELAPDAEAATDPSEGEQPSDHAEIESMASMHYWQQSVLSLLTTSKTKKRWLSISSIQIQTVFLQIKAECASMLFIELLFGKDTNVAESLRDEYNWKVPLTRIEPLYTNR